MDSIFIIYRDIWPEFYPKVILEVIAKVLFPALVENIMMFLMKKYFPWKCQNFKFSVFFKVMCVVMKNFCLEIRIPFFFIWIWGNAVRIGLSNAIDWNFDTNIEFHLEKNNRNAITQSMDFYKKLSTRRTKNGVGSSLKLFHRVGLLGGV